MRVTSREVVKWIVKHVDGGYIGSYHADIRAEAIACDGVRIQAINDMGEKQTFRVIVFEER